METKTKTSDYVIKVRLKCQDTDVPDQPQHWPEEGSDQDKTDGRGETQPGEDLRGDTDLHDASKTVWPQPESPDTPGELPILRLTVRHLHLCQGPQQESSELATRKASG